MLEKTVVYVGITPSVLNQKRTMPMLSEWFFLAPIIVACVWGLVYKVQYAIDNVGISDLDALEYLMVFLVVAFMWRMSVMTRKSHEI